LCRWLQKTIRSTISTLSYMFIEESLRQSEFAYIEFRNSPVGRQAYMKNSNLAVWQVIMLGQELNNDVVKIANHLQKSTTWVQAAFNYLEAYTSEIDLAIQDDLATGYTTIKRLLPQTELLLIKT
jgi:hypothetical protein